MVRRSLLPLALAAAILSACTDEGIVDPVATAVEPGAGPRFSGAVAPDPQPRLYSNGNKSLGWAYRRSFTTASRVSTDSLNAYLMFDDDEWPMYNAFYEGAVDDSIKAWAADTRLNVNPSFVAALLVMESGLNPHTFEGGGVTYGYAQMGPTSDGALIQHIDEHPDFAWMKPQVHPAYAATNGYSRSPANPTDSVALSQWYFSDPLKTTRAMVYHLKQIENVWKGTHKVTWGNGRHSWWRPSDSRLAFSPKDTSYAALAVTVFGRAPTETEMFDLVAVSYNRGYPWVEKQLIKYGANWANQLKADALSGPCLKPASAGPRDSLDIRREAACYLDRARHYTILFQNVNTEMNTGKEVIDNFDTDALTRWFTYQGGGSTLTRSVPPSWMAYTGTAVDEGLGLRVDYNIASAGWGGVGRWYSSAQNWKTRTAIGNTEGIGFWYYGNGRDLNSGQGVVITVELQDNKSADPAYQGVDTAERWVFSFRDNFIGWRYIDVPWTAFTRGSWQPHAATPNDGLTLTEVWGISFSPQSTAKWFRLDQFRLVQDRPWT
ncbi:MAG TPA: carbohydrate binding domain-containing protein [Longimicrobium sp.]|jgi:hypothetical protein|uniref:carbohydrate binding domain-containing protein n=1 Tax=Longimicrobium sp. TaxID=2029185 RepID=UPI002ED9755D